MSDLFCAATLLLARHGDADYVETWFSDEGGWLSAPGRDQARGLGSALTGRRVARIYSSDSARAVQTAEIVAAGLQMNAGTPVVTRKTLREVDVGELSGEPFDVARLHAVTDRWFDGDLDARFPAGESGRDVIARYVSTLSEIVDEHRGETVLVVAHQAAAGIAVASLTSTVSPSWPQTHPLGHGDLLEVEADADGWRLVR